MQIIFQSILIPSMKFSFSDLSLLIRALRSTLKWTFLGQEPIKLACQGIQTFGSCSKNGRGSKSQCCGRGGRSGSNKTDG